MLEEGWMKERLVKYWTYAMLCLYSTVGTKETADSDQLL